MNIPHLKPFFFQPTRQLRDWSLFMPKGGRCLEWGGDKIFKINEKGGVFF